MCPLCDGELQDIGQLGNRRIFKCRSCGVEYMSTPVVEEEEEEEKYYCDECGVELPEGDSEYTTTCEDCLNPPCPRCNENVHRDELGFPDHYEGRLDDTKKVCESCQDEYEDTLHRLMSQAQEEADEWFEESF